MQNDQELLTQQAIALSEVPALLPRRRGKKVHYLTVWRWATKGLRGKKLQSVKVGRTRYTTHEAIAEFLGEEVIALQSHSEQEQIDSALAGSGS